MQTTILLVAHLAALVSTHSDPAATPAPSTSWLEVAHVLGGSGTSADDRYVILVPSEAWGPGETPPAWIRLSEPRGRGLLRGTIPTSRDASAEVVAALADELPIGSRVEPRDTFGAGSSRVHVRFVADGEPEDLARRLRRAFERVAPGDLARVRGTGVVREDTFECEPFWAVVTPSEEWLVIDGLPECLRRAGTHVRFEVRRRSGRIDEFSYFGGTGHWRSAVVLESAVVLPPPVRARVPPGDDTARWLGRCEEHARGVLARGDLDEAPRALLASGFEDPTDPGFHVCPRCLRPLAKTWLFPDSTHDSVDATLHGCRRDALYFLSTSGRELGPFHPTKIQEPR